MVQLVEESFGALCSAGMTGVFGPWAQDQLGTPRLEAAWPERIHQLVWKRNSLTRSKLAKLRILKRTEDALAASARTSRVSKPRLIHGRGGGVDLRDALAKLAALNLGSVSGMWAGCPVVVQILSWCEFRQGVHLVLCGSLGVFGLLRCELGKAIGAQLLRIRRGSSLKKAACS